MENPILNVEQGQLRGRIAIDHFHGKYYSFQGIPYAKPPLGELRFKAPQPPLPWEGILDATIERDECYSHHMIFRHIVGSEDCLFLNVFTPEFSLKPGSPLKAVMVWIHGGGFTAGSSKAEIYSPDFLIAEDVVIVTINYRIGLLGFLALEDPLFGIPGNAGLKDMVMALKWVQRNIKQFGGDPDNITIFGESAGGAAVQLLMLSPMAKGLFHKAIAQSGSALNIWVQGTKCGKAVAELLGCKSLSEKEILKHLQEVPVSQIIEAQDKLYDGITADRIRAVGPVVENNSLEEQFLPDTPLSILLSGNYNKVPLIMGYTSREGMLFDITYQRSKEPRLISDFEAYVPYYLNLTKGSELSLHVAKKLRKFYFGDREISMENIDDDYLMRSDIFFIRGIYKSIVHHLYTSKTPIYLYRVCVETQLNFYKKFVNSHVKGVCHADELGYMWKMVVTPTIEPGSVEDKTVRRFLKLWTNFAKYGNPNPILPDSLIPVYWQPCTKNVHHFLNIDEDLTEGVNPEAHRMKFWDEIYSLEPASSKL